MERASQRRARPAGEGALSPRARSRDGVGAEERRFWRSARARPSAEIFWVASDTVEDVSFHPSSAPRSCAPWATMAADLLGQARGNPVPRTGWEAHGATCTAWIGAYSVNAIVTGGAAIRSSGSGTGRKLSSGCRLRGVVVPGGTARRRGCHRYGGARPGRGLCQRGRMATSTSSTGRIGAEQTPEAKKLGPPEVLFPHAGHRSSLADFHWNPCEPWTIASGCPPAAAGTPCSSGG